MAALSSLGLLAYPVQALPFHKTGNSFASWLNSLDWNSGKDYRFMRLHSCKYSTSKEVVYDEEERASRLQEIAELKSSVRARRRYINNETDGMSMHGIWADMYRQDDQYRDEEKARRNENEYRRLRAIYDQYVDTHIAPLEARIKALEEVDTPITNVFTYEYFKCSGYVRVSDPLGTRVCEIDANYNGKSSESSFETSGCRWK